MPSWISNLLGIHRRQTSHVTVSVDDRRILFSDRQGSLEVLWSDIQKIVVFARASFVGSTTCLLIESNAGRIIEINERMPDWGTFLANLERHIPRSKSRAQWQTQLVADSTSSIVLFNRDER